MVPEQFYIDITKVLHDSIDEKSAFRLRQIKDNLIDEMNKLVKSNESYPVKYDEVLNETKTKIYDELLTRSNNKQIVSYTVSWLKKYPKGLKEEFMKSVNSHFSDISTDKKLASQIYDIVLRQYCSLISQGEF